MSNPSRYEGAVITVLDKEENHYPIGRITSFSLADNPAKIRKIKELNVPVGGFNLGPKTVKLQMTNLWVSPELRRAGWCARQHVRENPTPAYLRIWARRRFGWSNRTFKGVPISQVRKLWRNHRQKPEATEEVP